MGAPGFGVFIHAPIETAQVFPTLTGLVLEFKRGAGSVVIFFDTNEDAVEMAAAINAVRSRQRLRALAEAA